jgi:hypothetical protein
VTSEHPPGGARPNEAHAEDGARHCQWQRLGFRKVGKAHSEVKHLDQGNLDDDELPGTHCVPGDANAQADCAHGKDLQMQVF